jgi:hypothetical protein
VPDRSRSAVTRLVRLQADVRPTLERLRLRTRWKNSACEVADWMPTPSSLVSQCRRSLSVKPPRGLAASSRSRVRARRPWFPECRRSLALERSLACHRVVAACRSSRSRPRRLVAVSRSNSTLLLTASSRPGVRAPSRPCGLVTASRSSGLTFERGLAGSRPCRSPRLSAALRPRGLVAVSRSSAGPGSYSVVAACRSSGVAFERGLAGSRARGVVAASGSSRARVCAREIRSG